MSNAPVVECLCPRCDEPMTRLPGHADYSCAACIHERWAAEEDNRIGDAACAAMEASE